MRNEIAIKIRGQASFIDLEKASDMLAHDRLLQEKKFTGSEVKTEHHWQKCYAKAKNWTEVDYDWRIVFCFFW